MIMLYILNLKCGLEWLDYRMKWEDDFRFYIKWLDEKKLVIFCGDLNVVYKEIDLKNLKSNCENFGFFDEEWEKFLCILEEGFIDIYCYFYFN